VIGQGEVMATILVLSERQDGEHRVAATPETVKSYCDDEHKVLFEEGAGVRASYPDEAYTEAGAELVRLDDDVLRDADIVLTVAPPSTKSGVQPSQLKEGAVWVSFFEPDRNLDFVSNLAEAGVSAISMELIPRITRAQSMDALSSQANLAGYKAVLLAAAKLPRFFPLLMTAAGTIRPAKVVVMGAGVAGLQAIATAKRLGAVVQVSDIRPEVEEQVQSLGAKFIPLPDLGSGSGEGGYAKEVTEEFLEKQREIVAEYLRKADVVITTALVPGRPAPKLVSADVVAEMKHGAVIVDLAATRGGNCELTVADETVTEGPVTIMGPTDLPSQMASDASALYARNLSSLLKLVFDDEGAVVIDLEDEILDEATLTHAGEVRHESTRDALQSS
jgi:NAD(P) transhydrogenase subunit alpha